MHVCTHTHQTHTPPCADFSSSCSFLLGTLKPVRVSLCPSLQTPISPSLSFCYISCVPASLPHFCLCLIRLLFPQSVFRVSYQIFHHVAVNKVKCSTPFFLHLFLSVLLHHRGWIFYLLSPVCNLAVTPYHFIIVLYSISKLIEHQW